MLFRQNFTKSKSIKFYIEKFENLIGISISPNEVQKILTSLGFSLKKIKDGFNVIVPTWRPDINEDVDLIEELIRIKGFESIKLIEPEKKRLRKR